MREGVVQQQQKNQGKCNRDCTLHKTDLYAAAGMVCTFNWDSLYAEELNVLQRRKALKPLFDNCRILKQQ